MNDYGEFLKQKNTGVFRLHDASGCNVNKYTVDLTSMCPNAYPEKATAYSFRLQKYQWRIISDIFLENSKLYLKGFHTLSIIGLLGEQSLDNLTLSSDGIKQLFELEPPKEIEELHHFSQIIAGGVNVGNYVFSDKIQLKSNESYLLRVIAFKGSAISHNNKSILPQIIKKDTREDIIVVFKAIRENEDKSWIILWKELARKDVPTINF